MVLAWTNCLHKSRTRNSSKIKCLVGEEPEWVLVFLSITLHNLKIWTLKTTRLILKHFIVWFMHSFHGWCTSQCETWCESNRNCLPQIKLRWQFLLCPSCSHHRHEGVFIYSPVVCINPVYNSVLQTASAIRSNWGFDWRDIMVKVVCGSTIWPVSSKCLAIELSYFLCVRPKFFRYMFIYSIW